MTEPTLTGFSREQHRRALLIASLVAAALLIVGGGAAIAVGLSSKPAPVPSGTHAVGDQPGPVWSPPPTLPPPPGSSPTPTAAASPPRSTPTTRVPTATTTTTRYATGVHPGAFCKPRWSFGYTVTGLLMQCKPSATDTRFRWRRA